jgi:penicillin-binding protein 1A
MSPSDRGRRAARPVAEYHPRRRRERRRARVARRRRTAVIVGALLVALLAALAAGALTGAAAFGSSCDLRSLKQIVSLGQNSFVYAADGTLLGSIPAEGQNRQPVPLKTMSPLVRKATIAIEDRRFYEHRGLDAEGIARALWEDIKAGKVVQGGSTIPQQLVRNLYISRERTLERKVREACLALKLSRAWSKDRILAAYMNGVYFGNHAYGVEAAAQTYFSKRARNLNLVESALLAGLPQAPATYDPIQRRRQALARRNAVLRAMLETGDITAREYDTAVATPIRLRPGKLYTRIREPYFFGYVREELIKEYGATTVRSGGLKVYTTIDRRFQRLARKAIQDTLPYRDDPAAALVSINPANGAIRAMTAVTPGRAGNQFNLASQARRQAGSTFKTFVLTAAIADGINPEAATYISAPFRYQPDPAQEPWEVSTYDDSYYGTSTVETATLRSDNSVFAQLTLDVGVGKVTAMARRLGIRTPLQPFPSLGLGAASVSPLEMGSAYATLAAGGIYSKPMAIRKVVFPDGKVDTEAGWGKPERRRAISDGVAYEVTQILEQNMLAGTGTGAYFGRPAAGKTGTTDNHADAWFCGYTPDLQTTVWVGYPRAQIPMLSVHGIRVAGGTFPAEIWRRFMERALAYSPPKEWAPPTREAIWRDFTRGDHALDYSYDDDSYDDDSYDDDSDDEPDDDQAPATTQEAPAAPSPRPSPARPSAPAPAPAPAPVAPTPTPTPDPPAEEAPPPLEEPGTE